MFNIGEVVLQTSSGHCWCIVLADDDSTDRKLTSLRTKQCIVSCELSSNTENADRFSVSVLYKNFSCHRHRKHYYFGCLCVCVCMEVGNVV